MDGGILYDAENATSISLIELTAQLPRPEKSDYCTLLSGETLLDESFSDLASVLHTCAIEGASVEMPVICLTLIWHHFPALLSEFEACPST